MKSRMYEGKLKESEKFFFEIILTGSPKNQDSERKRHIRFSMQFFLKDNKHILEFTINRIYSQFSGEESIRTIANRISKIRRQSL